MIITSLVGISLMTFPYKQKRQSIVVYFERFIDVGNGPAQNKPTNASKKLKDPAKFTREVCALWFFDK